MITRGGLAEPAPVHLHRSPWWEFVLSRAGLPRSVAIFGRGFSGVEVLRALRGAA